MLTVMLPIVEQKFFGGNKMKYLLSILAALVILSLVAACDDDETPSPVETPSPTEQLATEPLKTAIPSEIPEPFPAIGAFDVGHASFTACILSLVVLFCMRYDCIPFSSIGQSTNLVDSQMAVV